MSIALIIFTVWIVGAILFPIWDSYIGTGVDEWGEFLNENEGPSLFTASIFWFATVPILLFIAFVEKIVDVKKRRINKNKQTEKLRIAAQNELAKYEAHLEKEIRDQVKQNYMRAK